MCVICISPKGVRQPNKKEFEMMFKANPDGAGYMFINNDNLVEIHKGFMNLKDFMREIEGRKFTKSDVVIYHFRISTQGGVNPYMTHPFPLTYDLENTKLLDLVTPVGVVHNGIIPCTTCNDKEYSDTALFITQYLSYMVESVSDLLDEGTQHRIENLLQSKMAILDGHGNYITIGKFFTEPSGLVYSNLHWNRSTNYNVNLFDTRTWAIPSTIYNRNCK